MSKNKITYVCDIKGCNKERTCFKSAYALSDNHFCSWECSRKGRYYGNIKKGTQKVEPSVKIRIDKYFEGVSYES